MKLDTALWEPPNGSIYDSPRLLTKLHGSVDWQRHNEDIIVGNPNFTGDHQNHLILYPGYKGESDEEPFIKFHDRLEAVVSKTDTAIFIGFAFRDDEINDILSDLPSESSKYVINKDDLLPDFDFLDGCSHFMGGLTTEAVEDCLQHLKSQSRRSD